jgi:uncharacterized membrane protein YebE (DUF533 family)
MDKSKVTKIAIALLAIGGLGYLGYYLYNQNRLKSNDPQKNNRKIDLVSTTK